MTEAKQETPRTPSGAETIAQLNGEYMDRIAALGRELAAANARAETYKTIAAGKERQLATIEQETIERCAKVCDDMAPTYYHRDLYDAAAMIRALTTKEKT